MLARWIIAAREISSRPAAAIFIASDTETKLY